MQLAYIHEAVADYLETHAQLEECERRLASARVARQEHRRRRRVSDARKPAVALHSMS